MRRYIFTLLGALSLVQLCFAQNNKIFVFHTSDTHSCIEPISVNFSDTAQANKGGYLRRVVLLEQLRKDHPDDMLLFDCGDFSQGSAYYNLFKGEVEVKLMNLMKYDACTIGNHEFDFGLENLARLIRMAEFPFVCCNYDFTGTVCEGLVKPYIIKERAGVRVGILGVCPQPEGLVTGKNYEGMRYTKPAEAAQPVIDYLRNEEHCDVVVCLSHLGWGNNPDMDPDFIANTTGLDIVLGGHSHTYFNEPQYLLDKKGHEVLVDHQGKNARFLGTIEVMTGFQKE
ncbi:MAG: bifunctional metallophosphatase/5'-nucleotidase [Bacteroidaceae bacterium]|nr:bifunctional metallophosphatase/5'-nucleotidase [Bacteroidaceae bacterium]